LKLTTDRHEAYRAASLRQQSHLILLVTTERIGNVKWSLVHYIKQQVTWCQLPIGQC